MASYREICEQAHQELQNDKNREELVTMLRSWRSEDEAVLMIELENSEENIMSCNQDFLDKAKIFIDGTNSRTVWLFDPKAKLATCCELSSFALGDFGKVEDPSSELYQNFMRLLTKEFPTSIANPYVVSSKVQEVRFVNQVAIQQRLSIATPLLAALIEADAILQSVSLPANEPETLVKGALYYVDLLYAEVQK